MTEVESWRELQSQNIEFTMKRLREPIETRLQAILRRASASLPYGPADGDIVAGARPERLSHFTRECEAGDMVRASAFPINVKNRALSNPCGGVSIVE
jgi:hypothetical protein